MARCQEAGREQSSAHSSLHSSARLVSHRSDEHKKAQRLSFAFGNASIENDMVTRDTVTKAAADIEKKPTDVRLHFVKRTNLVQMFCALCGTPVEAVVIGPCRPHEIPQRRGACTSCIAVYAKHEGRFPPPTRNNFLALATSNPAHLVEWVTSGVLGPANAGFAAEQLGGANNLPPLTRLGALAQVLARQEPLAREGAVYGLGQLLASDFAEVVRALLRRVYTEDPSVGVQQAALDALTMNGDER